MKISAFCQASLNSAVLSFYGKKFIAFSCQAAHAGDQMDSYEQSWCCRMTDGIRFRRAFWQMFLASIWQHIFSSSFWLESFHKNMLQSTCHLSSFSDGPLLSGNKCGKNITSRHPSDTMFHLDFTVPGLVKNKREKWFVLKCPINQFLCFISIPLFIVSR